MLELAALAAALASAPPAARAQEARRRGAVVAQAPGGVYPVYDFPEGWLLFDRAARARPLRSGTPILVVGSEGAAILRVSRSSAPAGSCGRPPAGLAYVLRGPTEGVGLPVIGIRAPARRPLQLGRARVRPLANEVAESSYLALGDALRAAVVREVRSGEFTFLSEDSLGAHYAENPRADKVLLKIDFQAAVPIAGAPEASVAIETAQLSKSSRRCLRLVGSEGLIGGCAEMPHRLMAETQLLDLVAYDPRGAGAPFLLAFTRGEPMWGRERWGFQLGRGGPRRFLMDALDPRCRERF